MSKRLLAIIGTLVLALGPVAFGYYLNLNKPDVRYTLSEEIPLSFSSASSTGTENVQQLEIRNLGTAIAEKIVVRITKGITNYEVVKYTSSDNVDIYPNQQPVEFVYPSLPPQAGFKIIFTSSDKVETSDISISHNAGEALDALTALTASNQSGVYFVYILLFGGYFIALAIFFRNSSLDLWKSSTKRKRIDQALTVSKPWYIGEARWPSIHLEVIQQLLKEEYVSQGKVASSAAYGFLNWDKPSHFNELDWKELNNLAISVLKDHLAKSIDTYSEESVISVIRLARPERFPKDDWEQIHTKANEKYLERRKANLHNKKHLVKTLNQEKPEAIPEDTWQNLRNYCQEEYFDKLIYEINASTSPEDVLGSNDLEILDRSLRLKLEENVSILSKYNEVQKIINCLLQGNEISEEKPDTLPDWEWRNLKEFELLVAQTRGITSQKQQIEKERLELYENQTDLTNDKDAFLRLKAKVIKQLEFINDLLGDPTLINRVESYDDTFSPGNWENLKRISMIMSNQKAG